MMGNLFCNNTTTSATMSTSNEPIVITHTASGASTTILPYGATVTSFLNAAGHESLFVSALAKTDGSKATRGGIPLVFPQFGQSGRYGTMPQHGFLRCNYWEMMEGDKFDSEEGAGCTFTLNLKDVENARGAGEDSIWSPESSTQSGLDCTLRLSVKVSAMELTTTLTIQNSSSSQSEIDFDYQTLFHTYFKIYGGKALDSNLCNVVGLEGYDVDDKITGEQYVQDDKAIFVDREVDRIYTPGATSSDKKAVECVICTGEDGSKVAIRASAKTGEGEELPVSAVVWNPFIEKSKGMSDYGDEEYHDMVRIVDDACGMHLFLRVYCYQQRRNDFNKLIVSYTPDICISLAFAFQILSSRFASNQVF